jgi:hypothetical protein
LWCSSAWIIAKEHHKVLVKIYLHASHGSPSFCAGRIRNFRRVDRSRGANIPPQVRFEVIFERDDSMTATRMPHRSGDRSSTGYGPDPPTQEEARLREELAASNAENSALRKELAASNAENSALRERIRSLESSGAPLSLMV